MDVIKVIAVWCAIIWCAIAVHTLLVAMSLHYYWVEMSLHYYFDVWNSIKPETRFGVATLLSYVAALIFAPFIIIQLWRVQLAGRIGGIILLANEIIYSLARNYLLNTDSAWEFSSHFSSWVLAMNVACFFILLSRGARRIFEEESS